MEFTKDEIRETMKVLCAAQTADVLAEENSRIFRKLTTMKEFIDAECIGCYLSVDGEVDTSEIIKKAFEMDKKVCVPAYNDEINGYKYVVLEQDSPLIDGKYKIPEPKCKIEIEQSPDVAIIPSVAFDFKRNRLGHGKGYFDKLLATASDDTLKIGLAFSFQMVSKIDTVKTDIPMDKIVLSEGVIQPCCCCKSEE
ncbi:MAG: 5-formyltetrahydrofolate cyclo-ligase [Kiritimatiellae bacterium]|jgi:5-formyltetrahydrofolate cyclo-ligase|nr:5-formyltetrahydrofolate cyclo-ligase [Kiritimatiellia bacterium]